MTNDTPILEANGLHKTFRDFWGRTRTEAVRGVSLRASAGEVVGLLGPNGSGKSTTIKMLLGLLRPSAGEVKLFGLPPSRGEARRRLGYLPELSNLHKYLTPRETLHYYAGLSDIPGVVARKRIDSLLERVGLTKAADRPVGEFSKGMARRVGLAQALLGDPELVVLDEPTSGLDPIGRADVKKLVCELAAAGKTVLLSSHLLGEVADVCTRVVILAEGQIRAEGKLDELLRVQGRTRFTVDGLSDEESKVLADRLRAEGRAVEVDHPTTTLEAYFLEALKK